MGSIMKDYMDRCIEARNRELEYQKTIDFAMRLIQEEAVSLDAISKRTGLPLTKVQNLAEKVRMEKKKR